MSRIKPRCHRCGNFSGDCPDHEERRAKCKHLWAVEIRQTIETAPDGSTVVTESIKVTRKTYAQNWPAYNAAQCATCKIAHFRPSAENRHGDVESSCAVHT